MTFSSVGNLKTHKIGEHQGGLQCSQPKCFETFKYPHNLKDHIIYDHPEVPRVSCSGCTREFLEQKGLKMHKKHCKGIVIPRRKRIGKERVSQYKRQYAPKKKRFA